MHIRIFNNDKTFLSDFRRTQIQIFHTMSAIWNIHFDSKYVFIGFD